MLPASVNKEPSEKQGLIPVRRRERALLKKRPGGEKEHGLCEDIGSGREVGRASHGGLCGL